MLVDKAAGYPANGKPALSPMTAKTAALYFRRLELGPMQNFVYLVGDSLQKKAVVIDPGWEVPAILDAVRQDGCELVGAVVTHHHFDHVSGLPELLKAADIPVYAHKQDAPLIPVKPSSIKPTEAGQVIQVGKVPITVIHTPGHTPGSQCLLAEGHLFSGDTLFIGACGRCDLPGGSARQLYESLSGKLRLLDDKTILCPGHNYAHVPSTTLGEEKKDNPFLAAANLEQFLRLVGQG